MRNLKPIFRNVGYNEYMYLLVVESPDRRSPSLVAELRALGHLVDPVGDPRQVITRAAIEPFEAIVLDLAHAAESALLVLHELRESNRQVPILVVSADDQIHDRVTALIQGADDYLARPFTPADLQLRLESLAARDVGPGVASRIARGSSARAAHLERLLGNLLEIGETADGDFGVVISEVRLETLLERIRATLHPLARQKAVRLRLPRSRMPKLLTDARWLEYLLSSLLFTAISASPDGAEISISVDCDDEHCALELDCDYGPDFDVPLLRSYARCLRLRFESPTGGRGIRVSNLRRI